MKKKAEPLKEIANITKDFLKARGGLGNGYRTYVEGYVARSSDHIKWSVPHIDDYTGQQVKNMAEKFILNVRRVLIAHDIYEVRFIASHMEHGAYNTSLYQVSEPLMVPLGI